MRIIFESNKVNILELKEYLSLYVRKKGIKVTLVNEDTQKGQIIHEPIRTGITNNESETKELKVEKKTRPYKKKTSNNKVSKR